MEMTSKEYLLDEIANLKKDLNSLSKRVEKLNVKLLLKQKDVILVKIMSLHYLLKMVKPIYTKREKM